MDETTQQKLRQFIPALKALQQSTERSLQTGIYKGTGAMAVKSYRGLHQKISELLPDDFYVTESLKLEINGEADEQQGLSQVQLAADQLVNYLTDITKEKGRVFVGTGHMHKGDIDIDTSEINFEELKSLGRDLREQIVGMTKQNSQTRLDQHRH